MRFLVLLLITIPSIVWAQIPDYNYPIIDTVGVFDSKTRNQYGQYLEKLYRSGGPQVGVLIINELPPEYPTIEEYTIKVAEKWKLGREGADNGIIVAIAIKSRVYRIEVGRGLEGTITDLFSHRTNEKMLPYLKEAKYKEAAIVAVTEIIGKTSKDPEFKKEVKDSLTAGEVANKVLIGVLLIVFFIVGTWITGDPFFIFWIILQILSAGRGGGGRSSGGGGGFGGGGSSGRW